MKKMMALFALMTAFLTATDVAQAAEVVLDTATNLLATPVASKIADWPSKPVRAGYTAYAAGDIVRSSGYLLMAKTAGTTGSTTTTNTVTNTASVVVSGSLTPNVAGTYNLRDVSGLTGLTTLTNGAYAIWGSDVTNGTVLPGWKITTLANAGKTGTGFTNYWSGSALAGVFAKNGAYTGSATGAYPTVVSYVTNALVLTTTGSMTAPITDGSVAWLKVPVKRTAVIVYPKNGTVSLLSSDGDRIYVPATGVTLTGWDGAIYGFAAAANSTNEVTGW